MMLPSTITAGELVGYDVLARHVCQAQASGEITLAWDGGRITGFSLDRGRIHLFFTLGDVIQVTPDTVIAIERVES